MKRFILIIAINAILFNAYSQTSQVQWEQSVRSNLMSIDEILKSEKPANMDIVTFKQKLIKGEAQISEAIRLKIEQNVKPILTKYGREMAESKGLSYEDESDLIFYCVLSPMSTVSDDLYTPGWDPKNRIITKLSWDEVLYCAGMALGADAIYALSHSGASSWSFSMIKSVFKSVAKRFLGPIGVAIATITFSGCLVDEGFD